MAGRCGAGEGEGVMRRKAMRYNVLMPCGCIRKTALRPGSKPYAAYAAHVRARRCPVCGQMGME